MGFTLQCLGGCVIQTLCCFASTILETPQNFSVYAPVLPFYHGLPWANLLSLVHNMTLEP